MIGHCDQIPGAIFARCDKVALDDTLIRVIRRLALPRAGLLPCREHRAWLADRQACGFGAHLFLPPSKPYRQRRGDSLQSGQAAICAYSVLRPGRMSGDVDNPFSTCMRRQSRMVR